MVDEDERMGFHLEGKCRGGVMSVDVKEEWVKKQKVGLGNPKYLDHK